MNYSEIIKICYSFSDFCKIIGLPVNGLGIKKAKKIIEENNLIITHFDGGKRKKIKYERVKKECPVCKKEFETKKGNKKEKKTCSISCSNTLFRSGSNNGNWKEINDYDSRNRTFAIKYRKICFDNHKHECVVCGENKILDVHHFDENKFNNNHENLIPICATHHNYLHSIYREEVIDIVINYRNDYIKKMVYW
jgi:hypothetical protein